MDKVIGNVAPNIVVLRALGVPESSMSLWVTCYPVVMSDKVMSMAFRPSSAAFVKAPHVMSMMDASKWEEKKNYRKCGWTEDDFLLAFRKNPLFLNFLEMDFSI